jgi:hypothetical protein
LFITKAVINVKIFVYTFPEQVANDCLRALRVFLKTTTPIKPNTLGFFSLDEENA